MGTCSIFCLFLAFAHPDEWYFLMISQDKVRECNAVDHHSCITKSQDFFNFWGEGGSYLQKQVTNFKKPIAFKEIDFRSCLRHCLDMGIVFIDLSLY